MARKPVWTLKDQAAALREGWAIFNLDEPYAQIQRDDEAAIFGNDRAAMMHVERCESYGSEFHRKALTVVGLAASRPRLQQRKRVIHELARAIDASIDLLDRACDGDEIINHNRYVGMAMKRLQIALRKTRLQ